MIGGCERYAQSKLDGCGSVTFEGFQKMRFTPTEWVGNIQVVGGFVGGAALKQELLSGKVSPHHLAERNAGRLAWQLRNGKQFRRHRLPQSV